MAHRLITIGFTGIQTAYLDVSREAAIERWRKANPDDDPALVEQDGFIEEFDFEDEFGVYAAWAVEKS